ncbi:MAG: M20 family metallopeptidase [Steroidobacteraceae bacterium]
MRWLTVCALALLTFPVSADDLHSAVDRAYPSLERLYRTLHSHPELSGQEVETARRLAAEARASGFEVTEHVGGNGVVAVLRNGQGPVVLIRTEEDALPVLEATGLAFASHVRTKNALGDEVPVAHACGHDLHMTVWTGVGRYLAANRSAWSGTLIMIAQPAEETVGGARGMIADGLFTRFPRPDFNLAIHDSARLPAQTVGYTPGYALAAADSVDIEVQGVGGHGAAPQSTRDPVVLSSMIVLALQTLVSRNVDPQDPAVVTVGSIHGGTKHNIIGSSVHLQLTVRSYTEATRRMLLDGIRRIAANEARAFGLPEDKLPVVTVAGDAAPATYNDPGLIERLLPALTAALGKENLVKATPLMVSEDFAEYGRAEPRIPSVMLEVGGVDPQKYAATADKSTLPSLHSPLWAPAAEPTIKTGIVTLVTASLELFRAARPSPTGR